ncbi:hypothetical protein ALI144C_49830 [Actinosynnema sp. ALI-1.44]|uniref:hypothetical protein n=1 Tax=Actinosynnema sp. ALI-1.44 TaxID=1933779 RepID=UPI00097CA89A|nr:hypothetical protein [Actinosynnema sp. ALI-1.44]ONI70715.1 hypothetical protein ALI144C_49830 [Actinosynnema sp. ALI-1.44]
MLKVEQQRLADASPVTGTMRVAVWDIEGRDTDLRRLARTVSADVVCVLGISGSAEDGRLGLLAREWGMSAHVARDPAGDNVVIFTGCRVEVREFLAAPTAVAIVRADGWELTVVATDLCGVDTGAQFRHIRALSNLTGDVILCGCFLGIDHLLTTAGFRNAAGESVWVASGLLDYVVADPAARNVSDRGPVAITLYRPGGE